MDIQTARTFLAAAAAGSFAEAAVRVNASPSTVTERIKQLEYELRVRLFDRDKRGCRLTAAGRRFLIPAQNMLRAWQQGCEQAALPPQFTQAIRIGGQHALWPTVLIPWLKTLRETRNDLAFRATAAAPAQLNRALEDEEMDLAFLYDPVLRRGLRIEQLAPDRLILVTADPETPWQENFARIDWGEAASAELRARLGDLPAAGLDLDLGILSLDWLVETGACGFVPQRLATPYLRAGKLTPIEDMPSLEFSPFVCWRASMDSDLIADIVSMAKANMEGVSQ
ncbi:MAG: LysR family transcriptional regulator [Novosphingobium sp.]|nr:LysR family transcriptional regulator [Novosphingobium sp.]